MTEDSLNQLLQKTLEALIIKEIKDFQEQITQLTAGTITMAQFKDFIAQTRLLLLKGLIRIVDNHVAQVLKTSPPSSLLPSESLQEKEKFLENIAQRVQKIFLALED